MFSCFINLCVNAAAFPSSCCHGFTVHIRGVGRSFRCSDVAPLSHLGSRCRGVNLLLAMYTLPNLSLWRHSLTCTDAFLGSLTKTVTLTWILKLQTILSGSGPEGRPVKTSPQRWTYKHTLRVKSTAIRAGMGANCSTFCSYGAL